MSKSYEAAARSLTTLQVRVLDHLAPTAEETARAARLDPVTTRRILAWLEVKGLVHREWKKSVR